MRFAIPLAGGRLSPHFGHCEGFALIDVEQGAIARREDVSAPPHEPGLLPRWLAERGAQVVLAGGMGQQALALFAEAGIVVIVGAGGGGLADPEGLVRAYLAGTLQGGANACDHDERPDHACQDQAAGAAGASRLCVTAAGPSLDAEVDPRFGRAAYFVFVELPSLAVEALENPAQVLGSGAGIEAARVIAERGAEVLLTGHVGPKAAVALEAAEIEVRHGASGTVREAVARYQAGALPVATGATAPAHSGMPGAAPVAPVPPAGGGGTGGGRGMGGGGGRGMGGGGRCGGGGGGRGTGGGGR